MPYQIEQTEAFARWRAALSDRQAIAAIRRRLERASAGNLGDVKTIRDGVSEMRVDIGKGYRLYFTRRGQAVILLLAGGDKSTQDADIKRAIAMLKEL
jgi:putative addiction module killer protein